MGFAREWISRRLQRVARAHSTIAYSELATELARAGGIALDPHSSALAALLGQVNLLEHESSRPLISATVIYKTGNPEPGPGFWTFAREIGIDLGASEHARLEFWARELQRCHEFWSAR
jgi:hypothetical protein